MEWIDYAAKGIGFLVALGTFIKLAIEINKAIKNGYDFKNWFSYRRKVKGLKYLRIFQKRGALGFRNEISNMVKQQLTREIAEGRFTASREAVKREVERRVKERMILSRNRNYSRLATASP